MIKHILVTLYCCLFSLFCFSQQTDDDTEDTAYIEQDTPIVFTGAIPRKISADTTAAFVSDKDFAYMQWIDSAFRNRKPPPEKIPEKKEVRNSIFSNAGLRMLYWLIAITAVTLLLTKMFVGRNALFARNKTGSKKTAAPEEDIHAHDEEHTSLNDAIHAKNYRLATRILYLQALQLLGEKQYLAIAPQKTNYQYLSELNHGPVREQFVQLTLHYEYTWFGNFQPSEKQFYMIHDGFKIFANSIQS